MPCDIGSDAEVLRKEMEGKPVDLSLVHNGWNNKKGKWATDADAIEDRAKDARQWLKARSRRRLCSSRMAGFCISSQKIGLILENSKVEWPLLRKGF